MTKQSSICPMEARRLKPGFPYLWMSMIMALLPILSYGQQEWEKEGGIPTAEIEIVKDRQITLPPADRNFDKIPPRPVEPIKPEIVYEFKNLRFNTPDFNFSGRNTPLLFPFLLAIR